MQVERDSKIGQLSADAYVTQKSEILLALRKLGEPLSAQEEQFLASNSSDQMLQFERVSSNFSKLFMFFQQWNCSPNFSNPIALQVPTTKCSKSPHPKWNPWTANLSPPWCFPLEEGRQFFILLRIPNVTFDAWFFELLIWFYQLFAISSQVIDKHWHPYRRGLRLFQLILREEDSPLYLARGRHHIIWWSLLQLHMSLVKLNRNKSLFPNLVSFQKLKNNIVCLAKSYHIS